MNGHKLRKSALFSPYGSVYFYKNRVSNMTKNAITSFLALFIIAGISLGSAIAQDRVEISGTVTDASDGSTLPGVNITVKGMPSVGTTTNLDGEYTLNVPADQNVLIFSFIGFVRQEIEINGRSVIDVEMAPDVQLLDDVVVVGYGTQDKKEITSSVASVDAEEFNKGNIQDSQQLLQGKVSGLQITRPGGDPNAGFNIRLRGLSSIGANTEPLVVIDGVIGADFDTVDPNDIASIDVLKDASASAIYGTRGSNGVILVTTKSGGAASADKPVSVSYNAQFTTNFIENQLDVLTADEFRNFLDRRQEFLNSQLGPGDEPADLSQFDDGASTDWFDLVSQNGFTQVHNLSIAGGNATTTYRISGNFRQVDGVQKTTGNEQVNGRLNLTHRALSDRLTLSGSISIVNRDEERGFGEVFRYAAAFNPTSPVFDPDSPFGGGFTETQGFDMFNPVAIQELSQNVAEQRRILTSFRSAYDFSDLVPGLSAELFYSLETFNETNQQFFSRNLKFRGFDRNGLARTNDFSEKSELFETTVRYSGSVGDLRLEGVGGYSFQEFTDENRFIEVGDFITDGFSFNRLDASKDIPDGQAVITSFANVNRLIAAFGRVNFTYDNTYFLSGSYRREGSTRFGSNNRWGNFFAISGGVELTNLIDIPKADNLKLRASFGRTGTQPSTNGLAQLVFQPTGGNFLVDGEFIPVFGPARNPNPDLKWEVKEEINLGLDFEFFDSRLSGTLDVYRADTEDAIFPFQVPVPPNIFPIQDVNIGELRNEGIEASVSFDAIRNQEMNWTTSFTFSTFDTELQSLSNSQFDFGDERFIANVGAPGLNDTELIRVKEGRSIGEIWGPKFVGFDDNGEWLFENAAGDVVGSDEITQADGQVLGNGLPDFELGWNNTFNYQGWDLNMFWRGSFGHDLVNSFAIFQQNPSVFQQRNILDSSLDIFELQEAPQFSSLFVEDASFFKLDNITVGYTFPLGPDAPFRRLRVYASGNNLLVITGYDGIDPEARFADPGPTDNGNFAGTPNLLAPGIERRNEWFTVRQGTIGINVDF